MATIILRKKEKRRKKKKRVSERCFKSQEQEKASLIIIIKSSHVRVRKTANDFAVMRVTDVIPASKAASSADLPHNTCMHS